MILSHLRSYTAGFHENLETKLEKALFKTSLTPAEYHNLLHCFLWAYKELERSISQAPEVAAMLNERTKLPLLQKDIQYMKRLTGIGHPPPCAQSFAQCCDPGMSLGILYVMEGATLGGRQISNYLMRFRWIDYNGCLNFFNSYGAKRSEMWKEFICILEKFASENQKQVKSILQGARSAFKYMDLMITTHVISKVHD